MTRADFAEEVTLKADVFRDLLYLAHDGILNTRADLAPAPKSAEDEDSDILKDLRKLASFARSTDDNIPFHHIGTINMLTARIERALTPTPPNAALAALLNYRQADMDGTMVLVSRQAIHEVVDYIKELGEAFETIRIALTQPNQALVEQGDYHKLCAQCWDALGITEYTGKHIVEHIRELKAATKKQEPVNKMLLEALREIDENGNATEMREIAQKAIAAAEAQPAQTVEGLEDSIEWAEYAIKNNFLCDEQGLRPLLQAARLQLERQKGGE